MTALTTFSDLIAEVHALIVEYGASRAYADAVCSYLALAIGRSVNSISMFTRWRNSGDKIEGVFARQAVPIIWDFAESNPFCNATQNWTAQIEWVAKATERLSPTERPTHSRQLQRPSLIRRPNLPSAERRCAHRHAPSLPAILYPRHSREEGNPERGEPSANLKPAKPRRERGRPARIVASQPRIPQPSANRERQTPSRFSPVIPAKAGIRTISSKLAAQNQVRIASAKSYGGRLG